jgi:hypothetical protein
MVDAGLIFSDVMLEIVHPFGKGFVGLLKLLKWGTMEGRE